MNTIEIGRSAGKPVNIDLEILLRTRLLIQANSGGGKSWLLRRLAEQLSGQSQVLIIDPEGEFSTLREHFPFVLVGRGGDTPAAVHSAPLVAHTLLELGVSAVCDLFEMKVADRHAWVAAFLGALIDAPKTLWHPAVVMVDECHVFAPERGAGESEASEGVAALATRGRKRGFCLVAATQRLGKLRKDVAAELQNVLVGPTFLDLDRDRAAEVLGIPRADRKEFDHDVKVMPPGQFFALGRAVSTERIRLTVGPVVSSHPEPGSSKHGAEPPPPPDKIRHLLAKLGDLPKEAERKAQTEAELRAEIMRLRNELATAPGRGEMVAQLSADAIALAEERDRWRRIADDSDRALLGQAKALDGVTVNEVRRLRAMELHFEKMIGAVDAYREEGGGRWARGNFSAPPQLSEMVATPRGDTLVIIPPGLRTERLASADGDGAMRMLRALAARHPTPLTEQQVSVLAGMKRTGGTYRTYRGKLTGQGLVTKDGQFLRITDAGLKAAGKVDRPATGAEMLALWLPKFSGKARDLLDFFAHNGRLAVTKQDALRRVGLDPAGGTARTYWGQINGCGLIERTQGGFRAVESLVVR